MLRTQKQAFQRMIELSRFLRQIWVESVCLFINVSIALTLIEIVLALLYFMIKPFCTFLSYKSYGASEHDRIREVLGMHVFQAIELNVFSMSQA